MGLTTVPAVILRNCRPTRMRCGPPIATVCRERCVL